MSLFKNSCSFLTFNFSNDLRMEGMVSVLQNNPAPSILETYNFYSTGVCGHSPDMREHFWATENLVGFAVKKFEKVIDKEALKQLMKKMHEELYNGKKLKKDEKEHIEAEARRELCYDSPVKTHFIECLIDTQKKRLYIANNSGRRAQSAVIYLESLLGLENLRQRSYFSEKTLDTFQTFADAQQLFLFWLYQISFGDLKEHSPIKVKIDNRIDFRSAKTRMVIGGELEEYGSLYDQIEGFKELKSVKMSFIMKDPEAEVERGEEPPEYARYSYELFSNKASIHNYRDAHYYYNAKHTGGATSVINRSKSLNELVSHFDTLVDYFEKWLESIDPLDTLAKVRGADADS